MTTTTTNTAAAIPSEVSDLMDDLTGFHPALDRAVAALGDLITADLTTDESMCIVAALGGLADGSFRTLVGMAVREIGNPDTNPALAGLPADRQQTLRRLGAEHVAAVDDRHLDDTAAEMAAVIERA